MALTSNFRPAGVGTYDGWTLGAGATKVAAVDPGNPVAHDDLTSYLSVVRVSAAKQSVTLQTVRPEMASITSVQLAIRWRNIDNATGDQALFGFARLRGVDGADAVFSGNDGNWGIGTVLATLPRPGGGAWAVADVLDPTLEVGVYVATWEATNPNEVQVTSLYLVVTYEPLPTQISQAREVLSRRLYMFLRPNVVLETAAPLLALDQELLDDVAISDYGLPLQRALGDSSAKWARSLFRVMQQTVDIEAGIVGLTMKGLRSQLATFRDVGRSLKTGGPTADGVARLDVGNARLWTRASKAWIPDPSDGLVKEVQNNGEKMHPAGMLFERASTNGVTRSSFISQLTGWTEYETSGSITADTSEPSIFEPAVTGYVLKLTAGSPHTANLVAEAPASVNYNAGTRISVSFDYREESGNLHFRIRRNVDSFYYDPDTDTWAAAIFNIPATESLANIRQAVENIDVGGAATTITVAAVLLSGGVAGRIAYVQHVQVEASQWATSRIVTDASTVTRLADVLTISNNVGARCWPNARGTLLCEYVRSWGAGASGSQFFTLFHAYYDANNYFEVYYDFAGPTLYFKVAVAGVTSSAGFTGWTPTPGAVHAIAARWTSGEGELGLAAFSISVFVDGVKGTDAIATAMPSEVAQTSLFIGSNQAGTRFADGIVRAITITQQVLTDNEIARGGP